MMAALARLRNAIRRDTEAIVAQSAQPRFATVASTDETTHSVRVYVQPEGVLSGWIPDASAVSAGGGYGIVCPLSVGDQVKVVFSHADADHPVIIGRIFSAADPVPQSPATGAHAKPGELLICPPGGGYLHFQSDGTVEGGGTSLTWNGPATLKGNLAVEGSITATGDVIANGISVENHTHPDVEPGSGNTGKPKG